MSLIYSPSSNATAGDPWDTAFLSDRDVSSQVPINFVPHPGIIVTSACFADGVYDNTAAQLCLSNLLASELRRFVFDLYWDQTNRVFGLCPVQIPKTYASSVSSGDADMRTSTPMPGLEARQVMTSNGTFQTVSSSTSQTVSSSASTTTTSLASTTTSSSGATLVELGPYKCSPNLNLHSIVTIFNDYLAQTSNTIDARLQFIIFNLHTAASPVAPTLPITSLTSAQLPQSEEVLSARLDAIDQYFYTPANLEADRENLNASWYRRAEADQLPLANYFTTIRLPNDQISTPDGWPNENYVQFGLGKRIMSGIGLLDDALASYDFQADSRLLFPPGELYQDRMTVIDDSGSLTSGCFYDPNETQVSQVNNSWASSSITNIDLSILGYAADNFTTCGISPMLNTTLNRASADDQPVPYQTFGDQALFSWASGEPKNGSSPGAPAANPQYRCALMVSTDAYKGHWRVEDCQQSYRTACREVDRPYLWRISDNAVPYANGESTCIGNTTFDVPRTGLENTYLYEHILAESSQNGDQSLLEGVWVNFNALDFESCWVVTGPNGTCPYFQDEDAIRQRQILVPAIAAFIVLLLTVLTMLVKCNANHQKSKVRKRGEGGWDYEGVPS